MMLAFAVGSSAARGTPAAGVDAVTSVAGAPAAAGAADSMAGGAAVGPAAGTDVGAAVGSSVGTDVGAAAGARIPGSGAVGAGANSARRQITLWWRFLINLQSTCGYIASPHLSAPAGR